MPPSPRPLALLTLLACGVAAFADEPKLVDVLESSGIDYENVSGDPEKSVILSSLGGGAALFDYDGDGDLDVFFVNGERLDAASGRRRSGGGHRLYRNEGGFRFRDVSDHAGVRGDGWGIGAAVGDVDDDGIADLYVTRIGPNVLYRGLGDGTFEDATSARGGGDDGFGASAAFFDADGDGDLDLYVANYVSPDLSRIPPPGSEPTCSWLGMAVMCGPRGLEGQADAYYRNEGGRLVEATSESGLRDATLAFGLGVVSADYDDDGDADLYVANDTHPNFLYRNDGAGRFEDVGLLSGAAYNASGETEAGMGVDFGDANGDGRLDLFVTNFSHETNTFYAASGEGWFSDATDEVGLATASLGRLGWGARFADFDLDGDRDLFVVNGHVYPEVASADDTTAYRQRNQLFLNDGAGRFTEAAGALVEVERSSRGAAVGDLDGDGDPDAVVVNIDDRPHLHRNDLSRGGGRSWIGLALVGRRSNRSAYGARASLVVARSEGAGVESERVEEVHASGSIFSSSDPRVVFGLEAGASVEEIRIRWPGGRRQTLAAGDVERNRYTVVVEDSNR